MLDSVEYINAFH